VVRSGDVVLLEMATRSRTGPAGLLAAAALLALAGCAPGAPPGVDKAVLDEAVSRAIGDPNSCLLIAEKGSGDVLYRYNTATACAREFPDCDGPGTMQLKDLLKAVAGDGRERKLSCNTLADGSRGVGWAAGPIAGRDWVYAAMMEGDRAFPGMMMADRLQSAFRRARVSGGPG
jgi:hypothetical protein